MITATLNKTWPCHIPTNNEVRATTILVQGQRGRHSSIEHSLRTIGTYTMNIHTVGSHLCNEADLCQTLLCNAVLCHMGKRLIRHLTDICLVGLLGGAKCLTRVQWAVCLQVFRLTGKFVVVRRHLAPCHRDLCPQVLCTPDP